MAHLLYEVDENGNYRRLGEMQREKEYPPIQWRTGLIYSVLDDRKNDWSNLPPYKWRLTEEELIIKIPGVNEPLNKYAIVFDIKPSSRREVLLLRFKEMWGYTDDVWTTILLKLETLREDIKPPIEASKLKGLFKPREPNERKTIFEFLYLNGGYNGGRFTYNWGWGQTGRVNAALLYPDALDYFLPIIHAEK